MSRPCAYAAETENEMCAFKCAEGLSLNYFHAGNEPRAPREEKTLSLDVITGRQKQILSSASHNAPAGRLQLFFRHVCVALQLAAFCAPASPSLADDKSSSHLDGKLNSSTLTLSLLPNLCVLKCRSFCSSLVLATKLPHPSPVLMSVNAKLESY
jgi:hypothetical protein